MADGGQRTADSFEETRAELFSARRPLLPFRIL